MTSISLRLGRRATLALGLAMPFAARAATASLSDALGRSIALRGPAERIVLGFNYEEFTAIAGPTGWDRVVGFSRALWSDWRPSAFRRYSAAIPRLTNLPDVGNTDDGSFSMEKLLALRPDLVILPQWAFVTLGPQVAQLEGLGIPVLVIDYNAQMPERHVASTRAMGISTGNAERGEALARKYLEKLADIQRRAAAAGAHPRAYVELGQAGADSVGNTYTTSMWGRMLDLVGGANIATGKVPGPWGPLNPEYVLAADPQAIFIAGSSWVNRPQAVLTGFDADLATTRARLAPYAQRQGWSGLSAIRDGQLFAVEHGLSRALFDYTAMQFMAKALFPAQFTDVDPEAELRRYHEQYLPVRFEGCWMARLSPATA